VELGDDAGVGHHPRIGREEPRHVLPQRHPRGAERPSEQGRGEIRAAAAERRDLAVGRGADEPRDHRNDTAGEQGHEGPLHAPVGAREVRGGPSERAVGVDEIEGVDVLCLGARRLERRGHQARAQPLAARGEVVGGAGRELAEQP
jgi:hypothetical protein